MLTVKNKISSTKMARVSCTIATILIVSRKSHHPIETLRATRAGERAANDLALIMRGPYYQSQIPGRPLALFETIYLPAREKIIGRKH